MISPQPLPDMCIKCNICVAACPVMPATDLFQGPKASGPGADRFAHPQHSLPDYGVEWCSGCGVCSRVCPHNVPVTELNIRLKARLAAQSRIPLRDHLISRPDTLQRLARPMRPVANFLLRTRPFRWLLEKALGVSRQAPIPEFSAGTFRQIASRHIRAAPPEQGSEDVLALFHGCNTEGYEPDLGLQAIEVLEYFGFDVIIPPQTCCGLPLQSNGLFDGARAQARENITKLLPFAQAGIPIIGTSTSCTLSLRHDYREILGISDESALAVAGQVRDFFEFLAYDEAARLNALRPTPLSMRVLYHAPCQLKAHGMGTPALQLLRRIPDLKIQISESECCGVAGTYGMKAERYSVATEVGRDLFHQIETTEPDFVVTDSETCRWWISHHTGKECVHPLQLIHRSLRGANGRETGRVRKASSAKSVKDRRGAEHGNR